jgi:hypothetical protein
MLELARTICQVRQVGEFITLPELMGGVRNFAGTLRNLLAGTLPELCRNFAGTLQELCRNFSSMFLDKQSLWRNLSEPCQNFAGTLPELCMNFA